MAGDHANGRRDDTTATARKESHCRLVPVKCDGDAGCGLVSHRLALPAPRLNLTPRLQNPDQTLMPGEEALRWLSFTAGSHPRVPTDRSSPRRRLTWGQPARIV